MRGRQVFMESLVAHGVERIFGNPGTTESPLLDSLAGLPLDPLRDDAAGKRSRSAQRATTRRPRARPASSPCTWRPGLGNAIGMMYGALRAGSPMVITAGQQDTRLRLNNPVLGHDLVAMAAPVTKWTRAGRARRRDGPGPAPRLQGRARRRRRDRSSSACRSTSWSRRRASAPSRRPARCTARPSAEAHSGRRSRPLLAAERAGDRGRRRCRPRRRHGGARRASPNRSAPRSGSKV